ncbi:unnamed protein product [Rhizophagus irregularis]|nr:unnamed protein product [Rhizophagus irregularis]
MVEKDFKIEISNEIPLEKKDDYNIKEEIENHRKSIDRIFVSQYIDDNDGYGSDDYVVTCSYEDKSVLGWSINIEKNEYQPQPGDYFKIDQIDDDFLNFANYVLSRKILFLYNRIHGEHWLIDFNSDRTSSNRFLELKHRVSYYDLDRIGPDGIGFLPNGDLIQVSLRNRKIYKYCLTDKPKNTDLWEYSQINDIEIPESLYSQALQLARSLCRTKLFILVEGYYKSLLIQFDLLTMNFESQYTFDMPELSPEISVNKNQTLLALLAGNDNDYVYIFSMESGKLILKYHEEYYEREPVEFITLKNNSERLIIYNREKGSCALVDPYQVYDTIDISDDDFNDTSVITKSNKKIYIDDDNNVCVTNGLDENKLSNKIMNSNSNYTLPTFKIIQSMLNEIIAQEDIKKVVPFDEKIVVKDKVEIKNLGLCKIVFYNKNNVDYMGIEENDKIRIEYNIPNILSFKLLNNNQDVVLIHMRGIAIYTINEDGFKNRYFWCNNEWNNIYEKFKKESDEIYDINFTNEHYKPLIRSILKNDFDDSKHSILPEIIEILNNNLMEVIERVEDVINDDNLVSSIEMLKIAIENNYDYVLEHIVKNDNLLSKIGIEMFKMAIEKKYIFIKNLVKRIKINDNLVSKIGIEILKIAIEEKYDLIVKQFIDNTSIKLIQDYSENYMTSISLNLLELCDYYPDFIIKYISCTSFILSPYSGRIGNSKNTSLHSYTKDTLYAKESYINKLIQNLRVKEEIQTVSFIVPFPQICVYRDDNDHDNHSNNFYNLWNFAAIIDFKWKTFGRVYYFSMWLFYTIFYVCYSLASTLEQNFFSDSYFKLLYIISIIFGSIFLILEIRHFLWNYKIYLNDIWNFFDTGAYLLPIIASIFWLINKSQPPWLTAISIILLILGYAQAFFIVLRSNSINDDNDPRNLATKYKFVNPDGTISNTTTIIQDPDSNTNLFNWFLTSLLAVYNLLTGDSGSLSPFTYRENPIMTILLVTFTFFTVIYLMNLFIGLLNLAIDDYNKEEEYLLQKAQIIMEIELFYMLPWQRNKKEWFPDWIYYDIPVTEIRKLINAIDNEQTVFTYPPIISKRLRELVVLTTNDNKKQTKEELTRELKEKMNKIEQKMEEKMDKIEQKMESIMKSLSKIK